MESPAKIDPTTFEKQLDGASAFELRRAVERLREGLFDPLAVRLLTAHESRLSGVISEGLRALSAGKRPHLCLCGAYGEGKTHRLHYIRDCALQEGCVVSLVNLDPRETPFHDPLRVYRAAVEALVFPDTDETLVDRWQTWGRMHCQGVEDPGLWLSERIPAQIPHRIRCALLGLVLPTLLLTIRQKQTKKHQRYQPRSFPSQLSRTLSGEPVSHHQLRNACKYRQVPGYRAGRMTIREPAAALDLFPGMAQLFQQMGYQGWVVLFDEGESIAQLRIQVRTRAYALLHRLFYPDELTPGLFPVLAFTDAFFMQVGLEDYGRTRNKNGVEEPYFPQNYQEAWRGLRRFQLQQLTRGEWQTLASRLAELHGRAYGWHPPVGWAESSGRGVLNASQGLEARLRIKDLVDQLDGLQQALVLASLEGPYLPPPVAQAAIAAPMA